MIVRCSIVSTWRSVTNRFVSRKHPCSELGVRDCRRAVSAVPESSTSDGLFSVSGKSVVITGGAQGIGRALAASFAQRGCRVSVLDFRGDDAQQCAKDLVAQYPACLGAQGIPCDVQDEAQVRAAAETVARGAAPGARPVDVLVNCAGVTRRSPAEEFPMEEFDRIHRTNARGSWCAAVQFGQLMMEDGHGGCIVNIDSFVTSNLLKHVLPYSMSKSGVQALTKGLALEWGPKRIRVNGLAPGLIVTPISEGLWAQDHMRQWALDQTPLGRMGTVEDLIGAVLFLASPAARFMTGQTLRVDGGISAGMYWPIDKTSPPQHTQQSKVAGNPGVAFGRRNFAHMPIASRGFATASQVIEADMNYMAVVSSSAFAANPFEGNGLEVNKEAGAIRGFKHVIHNGREDDDLIHDSGDSLSTRGVSLQRHISSVEDFYDDEEVKSKYYDEIMREAKRITGADRIVVLSHVLRQQCPAESGPSGRAGVRSGAFMVHGDFCDLLQSQLLEMMKEGKESIVGEKGLGLSEQELRCGRLVMLNFWRPLCRDPLQRAPLSVCDATSMRAEDLHVYAHDPNPPPLNYSLPLPNLLSVAASSPEHRWYFFPGMTRDECVIFKTYDSASAQPGNGVGIHSAFEDPTTKPDAPARESIEARVLCFFAPSHSAGDSGGNVKAQDPGAKWQKGSAETVAERPPMENVERLKFYRWLEEERGWDGQVGLTAKFTIPIEKLDVYLDIMQENIAGTRNEPGMIQYDLVPNFDGNESGCGFAVYWLLERFKSRHDLLTHVESAHYKRCQERFLKDMGGHPLVQIGLYRIDPVEPKSSA